MSNVTDKDVRHSIYAGLVVDEAEDALRRAQLLLAGIKGGAKRAVGSALTRAADAGKTAAKTAVAKEYTISQHQFLNYTKNINHYRTEADGSISIVLGYAGHTIPLLNFKTKVGSNGQLITQVKRNNTAEALNSAFSAQMGGHRGIYERIGPSRFPVKELFGPATPQMMYSNEEVLDSVEGKMLETFNKRIDHEILAIMNGWR